MASKLLVAVVTFAAATGVAAQDPPAPSLLDRLGSLCGQAFVGRVVENEPPPTDADPWATSTLVMHVRDCTPDRVAIPLHVGDDRSRTWLITRSGEGLRLAHDHRHRDGQPDAVTMYGGDSAELDGTRAVFPANESTRQLFSANGLEASRANVWTIELSDDQFVYQLERPGRLFKAVFDLTEPVEPPPPAWGV